MTRTPRPASGARDDELMSVADLAAYLGVPIATIYRWRYHRQGPLGYRIGRHIRYRSCDVEAWMEAQRDPRA